MANKNFYLKIITPHGAKYTDDVMEEVAHTEQSILDHGGDLLTSSIACGCAPNNFLGSGVIYAASAGSQRSWQWWNNPLALGFTYGIIGYCSTQEIHDAIEKRWWRRAIKMKEKEEKEENKQEHR